MQLISISWVRNEADVIETFVRHHCQFIDRMIIIDNRSIDNTHEILRNLQQEGLPLDIRFDGALHHRQGEALTMLLDELYSNTMHPDWILPLDADEFLHCDSMHNIRSLIDDHDRSITTFIPWKTYIPQHDMQCNELNILKRIQYRKSVECPEWYKVLIPSSVLAQRVELHVGSHSLVYKETQKAVPHTISEHCTLGHFPVRSPEQITTKVLNAWPAHLAQKNYNKGTCFQWKAIYDIVSSGKKIDNHVLRTLALQYGSTEQWESLSNNEVDIHALSNFMMRSAVQSENIQEVFAPIASDFPIQYPSTHLPPMQSLAEIAEQLAKEVSRLQQ